MKNQFLPAWLAAATVALAAAPAAAAPIHGSQMKMSTPGNKSGSHGASKTLQTVEGQVIDTWCYFHLGAMGQAHKACATACARNGAPMALLDAKGNLYVLASAQPHQGPQAYIPYMADRVRATGTVIRKGGVRLLFVTTMKNEGAAK